jgi:hypothetical protein
MADCNIPGQIENRNFLYPTQFKFVLTRTPKVSFFSNTANIPSMTLQIAKQPTYLKDISQPGNKIDFQDFNLRFLVDEDFTNYMEIYNWIKGLGYPETLEQIYKLQEQDDRISTRLNSAMNIYSDGTLFVLGSNQRSNFQVRFYDLFPYDLTTLIFDATITDANPFTAEVKFKYTYFEVTDNKGNKLYEYK